MLLADFLEQKCTPLAKGDELAAILDALAEAARQIAKLASQNGLSGVELAQLSGDDNQDGDQQKQLDLLADELITDALQISGASHYFSEERHGGLPLRTDASFAVAADPLDGSSNIDTNLTIGTIFSIFRTADLQGGLPPKGRAQQAAGLFIYGPQTGFLLSFGDGVCAFALNQENEFEMMSWDVKIPPTHAEFAINASNTARWDKPTSQFIETLTARGANMRWLGSLVGDAFRIFRRGGVFLYPADSRKNYENGRLRLVYEANPVAFLIEAAGGRASSGAGAILDEDVTSLHQRIPLIFGSAQMVAEFEDIISSHLTASQKE